MSDRPNILIIQADEHRQDCLGAYGNSDVKTPHIDSLAADGVRYDNSFCPYPVCTPSRYSFLTSLYPRQHLGASNHCTLPQGLPTFPRVLQRAGYKTKAVGKMHLTPTYADVGFDELILAEQNGAGRYDDDYHRWLRDAGLVDRVDMIDQEREYRKNAPQAYWDTVGAMVSDLDEAHHSTTWIADRAIDDLKTWTEGGHLLMASFIKPHHPFDPPDPWHKMYDPAALEMLPGYTSGPLSRDVAYAKGFFPHADMTEHKIRLAMAMYYATLSQIDYHVGRMIAQLKMAGLYDRTLILYNSDHGDYMGYHHLLLKGNYMYDPVIKVPLIVKYPDQLDAGSVSTDLVNTVDVGPTLLDIAGCEIPSTMIGSHLRTGVQLRPYMFAEMGRGREYMVRSHTHKLLWCKDPVASQFFDLRQDPFEVHNAIDAPQMQAQIAEMKNALAQWILFDAPAAVHLDEQATVIDRPNVPKDLATHRGDMYAYFEKRMHDA
jgi:arylsulfatase